MTILLTIFWFNVVAAFISGVTGRPFWCVVNIVLAVLMALLLFRNFSGRESKYNRAGQRNFCVYIDDPKDAQKLMDDGWNIRERPPREEGEDPRYYIQVAVSFENIPPTVYMIPERKKKKTKLDEESIDVLDFAEIRNVDLTIRPYNWVIQEGTKNEKRGVKAYLRCTSPSRRMSSPRNTPAKSIRRSKYPRGRW